MVCTLVYAAFVRVEGIVVPAPKGAGRSKAVAYFHALDSADGHDGSSQGGVQLVEDRLADARGQAVDPALYNAAGGVLPSDTVLQKSGGLLSVGSGGHIKRIFCDLTEIICAIGMLISPMAFV